MKKIVVAFAGLLTVAIVHAQTSFPTVAWSADPVLHSVEDTFSKESAVILEDVSVHKYMQDGKDNMYVDVSRRRLIKVNDDKGVEMYNKIYVPIGKTEEIVEVKARVIQPGGKVVNLPSDKILDQTEEGHHYKLFALEGVVKGSEIEYIYHKKCQLYFFGMEYLQSSSTPYERAYFTLVVPQFLQFSVKGYNGIKVSPDTVINDQRYVYGSGHDIIALDDEKYGEVAPYLASIQYKLSYNLNRDKNVRLFTWNDMAKNVYANYTTFNDKETKSLDNFIKQIKITSSASEEEKIIALEEYLKTTIAIDANAGADGSSIEKIIKTHVANESGIDRLYTGIMERMGINYQIVFPSRRDKVPFDEDLENYDLPDDIVFYFPGTGNFLEPANIEFRYPYIEPYWAATKGIFLRGTTLGSFKTALAAFDSIPLLPYEKTFNNLEISLKFDDALDSLQLHSKQIVTGYVGMSYRPIFNYLDQDKKDQFTKNLLSIDKSDSVQHIKVENTSMSDCFDNKPLIIEGDITNGELVEQAGDKLLVKIGEVIGPQVQMYQEKPRHLPVLIPFPHAEDREITFTIPAGYKVKNPDDLNRHVTDVENGQETMGFISGYTLSGNELKIKIHEFYKTTGYPLSKFEAYKKVINSSADFNKIVLVLEKIK